MSGSEAAAETQSVLPKRLEWLVLDTGRGIALFFGDFTVPAHQNFRLRNQGLMLARETVALWAYYARPLIGI